MFQGSLKAASRKLQGCFKEGFRETSRVFQESSKGVKTKIEGCLKEIQRKFQGREVSMSFQGVPRKFFWVLQESLKGVSRKFQVGGSMKF